MAMKKQLIKDLKNDSFVDSIYKIESYDIKPSRLGTTFLSVTLSDKTGRIAGKRWDVPGFEVDKIRKMQYARVQGQVEDYKGALQIRIEAALEDASSLVDASEFEPVAALPLQELRTRLNALVQSVKTPPLYQLLVSFFCDDRFRIEFETAPAAKGVHHACRYGLMQHTIEVAEMTDAIAKVQQTWGYPGVSRDLAVTGALLHDIGKIKEIDFKGPSYNYTTQGGLIGHITIGYQMVLANITAIQGFPDNLRDAVLHIILSHHGKLEHGSPVTPMLREALIVNAADNLDARLFCMGETKSENENSDFGWHRAIEGGRVYTGSLGLADQIKEDGADFVYDEEADIDSISANNTAESQIAPDTQQISLDLSIDYTKPAPQSIKIASDTANRPIRQQDRVVSLDDILRVKSNSDS